MRASLKAHLAATLKFRRNVKLMASGAAVSIEVGRTAAGAAVLFDLARST